MPGREVARERLDLQRNREVLSPPYLVEPLYRCAISVTARGFLPHAELDVDVDGAITTDAAGFPHPHGHTVLLPDPLEAGQEVRVRQRTSIAQSDWSDPVTVRDHTEDYPAGPPRPQISPAPVYACGSRSGVANILPGGVVWITADGNEVGKVDGCSEHQGVNVNPDYSLGEIVRAHYELCADESAPSVALTAGTPPSPLPAPGIDDVYEGGEQVTITNVVNGARVTVYRNGTNLGTWRCWGYALLLGLGAPMTAGETFSAEQRMCPGDPTSAPGTGTVQPCSALPAPVVHPVQLGDQVIHLSSFVPDAVIEVYLGLEHVGTGSGPAVPISRPVAFGDIVRVAQNLGSCVGSTVYELDPMCVAPPLRGNPAGYDVFPVGHAEYALGPVRGSVYYPAADDGLETPFNERLAALGRAPIVFMAHGNHSPADPSYLGYPYFQTDLAKMGIVAVSVDCNALNGSASGVGNIEDRADLIIDSIAHFQGLDAAADSTFSGRLDFGRVGLMGHSRGGDAVVTIPRVIALAGVTIRSVLALAPTNFRFWSGLPTIRPEGYAFMTVLPAGDGDVRSNNGAQFYDQAIEVPYKSQVYAYNTNHNFFNREWLFDDGLGPPMLARYEHERILSGYGCALFRDTLLGHAGMIAHLSYHALPTSVRTDMVHLSFAWRDALTIDEHDENNGIDTNSLGGPTVQTGVVADEYAFHEVSYDGLAPFNDSFHGESLGMVIEPEEQNGTFRNALPDPQDLSAKEVWIRSAEVYDARLPAEATGFELGLEDVNGTVVFVDVDGVGGLPRPYDRRADDLAKYGSDFSKTMLKTFRFPVSCFSARNRELELREITAVWIRCDRQGRRPIAFDDLQIVERVW
jgi:hypothetical protein